MALDQPLQAFADLLNGGLDSSLCWNDGCSKIIDLHDFKNSIKDCNAFHHFQSPLQL